VSDGGGLFQVRLRWRDDFSGRRAATLPPDAIVLETDAPDISPAWLAGGRNSPAEVERVTTRNGVSVSRLAVPLIHSFPDTRAKR
jgi:hypothetical protein